MTRKQVLLKRGFSEYDIDTDFKFYTGKWNINTMTKEDVIKAKTEDELKLLFYKDSVDIGGFCPTYIGRTFDSFAKYDATFNVSPSELDPNIARLCIALNHIGVRTIMSCDGWHKKDPFDSYNTRDTCMRLYMSDRYSVMWFWLITEYIFGERWCHERPHSISWNNIWEVFDCEYSICGRDPRDMMVCTYSPKEARSIFNKNNYYAEFMEKHKDELLALRGQIISSTYKKIKSGIISDIENIKFLELRKYMYEAFRAPAKNLIEAFRKEYLNVIKYNYAIYCKACGK